MGKATKTDKKGSGGTADVLTFKRPTRGPCGPLIAEIVAVADVDKMCATIGEYITMWTQARGAEFPNAAMWLTARSGQGFLIVAHDGETLYAASFWKPETWANGIVLRCVAAAGNSLSPSEWVSPFIDVAKSVAKASGAERLIFEVYDEDTAQALPENAKVSRQSYIMEA